MRLAFLMLLIGAATLGTATAAVHEDSAVTRCAALAEHAPAGADILASDYVSGGRLQGFDRLPPLCRVRLADRSRADSQIEVEVWLPTRWNGRYLQAGNGGFAGSILYVGLASGVRAGFAVANSNGGHHSQGADMSWAAGHPERVRDFGHRAIGVTSDLARGVIAAYYGHAAQHAYFSGCSDGGREALMAAQRFAAAFDGFLVGAPENDFDRELAAELNLAQRSAAWPKPLEPRQLDRLSRDALAACDAADGLRDGLIADPRRCRLDGSRSACAAHPGPGCLDADQQRRVAALYADWRAADGALILPGAATSAGTENDPSQWRVWLSHGGQPGWHEAYAQQFFGFVFGMEGLDVRTLEPGAAYAAAVNAVGADVDAVDTDLTSLRAAGKKMIQFHGTSDIGIPVALSLDYYAAVQQRVGGDVRDFYRLFLAPGVGHCGGGPGPNLFGQPADQVTPFDPRRNLLAALVDWVETGRAPGAVIASRRAHGSAGATLRTRPLCPYPQQAKYRGAGSIDAAQNFACE